MFEILKFWNSKLLNIWNFEIFKFRNFGFRNFEISKFGTLEPRDLFILKYGNRTTRNIPSPTPAPDQPLGGHEGAWGTGDRGAQTNISLLHIWERGDGEIVQAGRLIWSAEGCGCVCFCCAASSLPALSECPFGLHEPPNIVKFSFFLLLVLLLWDIFVVKKKTYAI